MRRQCSRCIRLRLIARHERVLTKPLMADNPREWSERSAELSRLLGRTGLGDRTAFAALYQHTSSHLFAVILRINRDRAQAEDLLQEVYVNVWRAAQASTPRRASRSPWLTSIARNRAIDSLRRRQTQPQIQPPSAIAGAAEAEDDDVYEHRGRQHRGAARPADAGRRGARARRLHGGAERAAAPDALRWRSSTASAMPRSRRSCASRSAASSRGCGARCWR